MARQHLPRDADPRGPPRRLRVCLRRWDTDDKQRAFFERLGEFWTYIGRNSEEIPNYGERHRCGEPISTATAEATVNQVISRRMVKKQQMRWSPRGAHLLLQVRTRVLNDDLAADFARWYPGLTIPDRQLAGAAYLPRPCSRSGGRVRSSPAAHLRPPAGRLFHQLVLDGADNAKRPVLKLADINEAEGDLFPVAIRSWLPGSSFRDRLPSPGTA